MRREHKGFPLFSLFTSKVIFMPVERGTSTKDGKRKPFYRWGKSGKKYFYNSGNERSRRAAHEKAARQGRAIKMRQTQGF